jgi:DNA-binding response OmpR family regulator
MLTLALTRLRFVRRAFEGRSSCPLHPNPMRVLLIEDHTDTRTVFAMLLNRCGCQIVTAKSIEEARHRLDEMPFDLVISDLNLPDGDGAEFVREAKRRQQLSAIAVTGRLSEAERQKALAAGFNYYLTKPVDFRELRDALNTLKQFAAHDHQAVRGLPMKCSETGALNESVAHLASSDSRP